MPLRTITAALPFDELRAELEVPGPFPPEAEAEAAAAAARPPSGDPVDLPFVTIDPPGSRDLDQALHIARLGRGYRVSYAIADVAAFVGPGGAIDREAWVRGVTHYSPDGKAPLHPPALSEGAASLLPGVDRPAILWALDLDADGALVTTDVRRALVRSTAQLTYAEADEAVPLLAEVGRLRQERERDRGGVSLTLPDQEVVAAAGGWVLGYRAPLPSEGFNAQISLLTGMAAAQLMLQAGVGVLRTMKPTDEKRRARLRRAAAALDAPWPEDRAYPEWVRSLDPADPKHAALMHEAAGLNGGASYAAFDGAPPEHVEHTALAMPYAHVTAPLRRLADRYALECCLGPPPQWVRDALAELPAAMARADRRAKSLERAVVDLVEALVLAPRVGEVFEAVAIDEELVQLRDPAVLAPADGPLPVGEEIAVRLVEADPARRTVRFQSV